MKGPFGYGRYDDGHIGCPRAQSDMTPCAARDGHPAIDDEGLCVGCTQHPVDLLVELVKGASAMESRRMFEGGVEREAWVVMAVFTASLSPEPEVDLSSAFTDEMGKTL